MVQQVMNTITPGSSANMGAFTRKTHTVSRGYTYNYYTSTPAQTDTSTPALLFCHGWPDDALLWQFIAPHFAAKYKILIPDALGAGETSKPRDLDAYVLLHMTQDYIELLDAEKITTFITIGHDWGAGLISRLVVFIPRKRVVGAVFVNIPYVPPRDERFDVDGFNQMSLQLFGYEAFAYWPFFATDEAGELLSKYPEKVWELCHGAPQNWMKTHFGVRGGIKNYLLSESNGAVELKPYAQDSALRQHFIDHVNKYGMDTWQNWYKAQVRDIHFEVEEKGGVDKSHDRLKLDFPVLFFGCEFDSCSPPAAIGRPKAEGLLPDLQEVFLSCGHWSPFEAPEKIIEALDEFLQKRF